MLSSEKIEQIIWSDYSHEDRDQETLNFFGSGFEIINNSLFKKSTLFFQPFTLGFFALAEMYSIDFNFSDDEIILILYLLFYKKQAVKNDEKLFKKFVKKLGNFDLIQVKKELEIFLKHSTAGFNLIPDEQQNSKKQVVEFRKYDSEWLTDILIIIQPLTGYTIEQIIWDVPLTKIGFFMASYSKSKGVKNVKRQPNIAKLREYQKEQNKQNKQNKTEKTGK